MNANSRQSPLVYRRRLRTELRRARAEAQRSQEQVAKAMDWSLSKVIRIENGAVGISTNDLRALSMLYGINDQDRIDELIELARVSRQPSWWGKYREIVSPQYLHYIEYEESATVIRAYEPLLLFGLLQTEEYIKRIVRALSAPGTTGELIRTRIEMRLRRQLLLEEAAPPTLKCVLDEAVIQHIVGDRSIADGQIAKLIDLARRPNVTIEVIPFSAGLHRGMYEPFHILEFPDPEDSDVVFLEGAAKDTILTHDETEEITGFRVLFEELSGNSMGPVDTLAYLERLMRLDVSP